MFLGLKWYWWLLIAAGVIFIIIPIKIKVLRWLNERQKEQKKNQLGKWGEEE